MKNAFRNALRVVGLAIAATAISLASGCAVTQTASSLNPLSWF
jgi:hypothetical protein